MAVLNLSYKFFTRSHHFFNISERRTKWGYYSSHISEELCLMDSSCMYWSIFLPRLQYQSQGGFSIIDICKCWFVEVILLARWSLSSLIKQTCHSWFLNILEDINIYHHGSIWTNRNSATLCYETRNRKPASSELRWIPWYC